MDKSTKKLVVQQIEVYLTKYPTATVKDIKKFIFSGSQAAVNIDTVKPNTLTQFIHYQMDKFNNMGSCLKRISGSGGPPTDKKVVSKKKLSKPLQVRGLLPRSSGAQVRLSEDIWSW